MRLIFMRHGESQNNILAKVDRALYQQHRTFEPELSERGVEECKEVGKRISEMGLQVDLFLTSAHKRALQSLRFVRENYAVGDKEEGIKKDVADIPAHLMIKIHEEGGVHMRGQTFPGLNREQVKEQCPGLQIPEDQLAFIDEEGWFKSDHEETFEEIVARVKAVLADFRQMAKRADMKDKTLFAVTHGQFIHYLCCNLMGSPDKAFT